MGDMGCIDIDIIFIEIGRCTEPGILSSAGEGAATARPPIPPRNTAKSRACAWRRRSVSTPNSTWWPNAPSRTSKSTSKSSTSSTTTTTECSPPWTSENASEILEATNLEGPSSMLPCQSSMPTMEDRLPSTSSSNWWQENPARPIQRRT